MNAEPRYCSACGKEPRQTGLGMLRWIGHHALCPRYGEAPDRERKP